MALLKTLAEVKTYVWLDVQNTPPSIALAMRLVESRVVVPLLGPALTAWLQAAYDMPGFDLAATTPPAELLRLVQAAISRLGVAAGLVGHQVSVDNTGVHFMATETSKTAFQWQTNQLMASLEKDGLADVDALVQWLEEHYDAAPELQAWAIAPAGRQHRKELFTCTADFQEYESIGSSRAVFQALRAVRRRLESFELRPVLGAEFLQELRDQVLSRTLTSDNHSLLQSYVYPALAALTIGHAIPELGLQLSGEGLALAYQKDSSAEYLPDIQEQLQKKTSQALANGARYLRHLRDYLDRTASAERFATYFHSAAYTAPNQPVTPLNTATSKTYKFC